MKSDIRGSMEHLAQMFFGRPASANEIMERAGIGVWEHFYPRKYAAPSGYTSPKTPAAVFTATTIAALEVKRQLGISAVDHDPVTNNTAAIGEVVRRLWMPTYWVGRELVQSAFETEPPKSLKPSDLPMPLPGAVFLLPLNTLVNPDGEDSSWLAVATSETYAGEKRLGICTGTSCGANYMASIKNHETLAVHENTDSGEFHPITGEIGKLSEADRLFSLRLARIGITLIMLMNARPALVETHTKAEKPPTSGKAARKLASPNWIGRTYRAPRSEHAGGTHASPHVHWRRGHWRHQAHGPANSLRKDIWIEPMIIGATTQQKAA